MIGSLENLANSKIELSPEDIEDTKDLENGTLSVLPGSNPIEGWGYRVRLNPFYHLKNLVKLTYWIFVGHKK